MKQLDLGNGLVMKQLKVYQLGMIELPLKNKVVDLSNYYIDEEGDLYSLNSDTYETKFGSKVIQLSNKTVNSYGDIINTLRSINKTGRGVKVTLTRSKLKRMLANGMFKPVERMGVYDI